MAKERELKWVKEAQEEMEEVKDVETAEDAGKTEVPEEAAEAETAGTDGAEAAGAEAAEEGSAGAEGEAADAGAGGESGGAGAGDEAADGMLAEAVEKYQRLFAEFDNFRKRSEKEKAARYDMGAKDIIEKVLPVLDSFELALKNVPETEADSPFVDGMEKIHKQFLKTLEDAGVTPIEAVGKEFDPAFHNAVMHVEDEEAGDNIVVEEFQKGYMYKEHVVRYSMVKVAN